MSQQPNLNKRSQNILKATIERYIATAEPVGSKAIANDCNLKVSSATIRNIMGRLEAAGLLYQPHTSAGRVPSDFGYRIYVDRLLIPDETRGKKLAASLYQKLPGERASLEALLQRATKILAALSGYIALITFPQNPTDTLRHIQLVRVASGQIMSIIVTDAYHTDSILIESSFLENPEMDEATISDELQLLSNFLNQKLKGRSLSEIAVLNWSEIKQEFAQYTDVFNILSQELGRSLQQTNYPHIAIHGIAEVLHQPEFSQVQQVQTLLYLLEEEKEQLAPVIFSFPEDYTFDREGYRRSVGLSHLAPNSASSAKKKVMIKIGAENALEPMQTCAVVSANYYQDEIPVGSVGVIGPTRMLYENAIALVETTADYLSEAFKY
ncbi:MAG TPA: heat-inducible transcriptional repressor HrcA [Xenococcaceae cyanobacterium]|jgi:heat-inducible transcriptional repressor